MEATRRFRRRFHQEIGNGDYEYGYRTIMHDFSNHVIRRGSFVNKMIISSGIIIAIFLFSRRLECASFLFEIGKPVYFTYLLSSVFVDLLAPVLRKFERWLAINSGVALRNDELDMSDVDYHDEDEEEDYGYEYEDEADNINQNLLLDTDEEFEYAENNNLLDSSITPENEEGSKGRKHRTRRRAEEHRPLILKALESEIRKVDKKT